MRKNYILDTNILIYDPQSIFSFEDNNLYVPIYVLEELDKLKSEQSLRGRNSREACRLIDNLRFDGHLSDGVPINDGGKFIVYVPTERVIPKVAIDLNNMDNAILQSALDIQGRDELKTILVTMDVNLRIRADSLGLQTASYESSSVDTNSMRTGYKEVEASEQDINELFVTKGFDVGSDELIDNTCVMLTTGQKTALCRFQKSKNKIIPVQVPREGIMGIRPRNREQQFALDMLLDDSIKLMTLVGMAGTGKTLLAVAAGLQKVVMEGHYSRLVISRPVVPMGKDIGFLPGPQPLDAKILTPTGWTTMGEISPGDYVISRDGLPTKVLDVFPQGEKEVFKLTTTDGLSTECCEDHLWLTKTKEQKKRGMCGGVKSTKDILNTLTKNGKLNHYLPRNEAVQFEPRQLPLKPYTLGALIGDGSFSTSIALTVGDSEIADRVNEEIKDINCYLSGPNGIIYTICSNLENNKPAKQIEITDTNTGERFHYERVGLCSEKTGVSKATINYRCNQNITIDGYYYEFIDKVERWSNPVKNIIYDLGLLNKKCYDKFIPDVYKYSSVEDRINLIRGLMDTDGTVKKNGEASFTTTSKQLAWDVCEIIRSLGGRATIRSRNRVGKITKINDHFATTRAISYEFSISLPENLNPFYLPRKRSMFKCSFIHDSKIKSIELVGTKECKCILIENDEHLYITDNFIVTHNTLEEKMNPWMQPIYDNLELLMMTGGGKKKTGLIYDDLFAQDLIRVEPLTYIRGRSLPNQFIIIDESQNLTPHEVKTIITRCGENTKIILTGDPDQIDNPYMDKNNCGLSVAVEKLQDNPIVGHLLLSKGERSELANLAATQM